MKIKKGFFFSIVSLVLLIYIFSSISYKINYVQEQSKTYKETIKLASYELIFSQLGEENIDNYFKAISTYAILKLANFTSVNPIKPAGSDGLDNVRAAFTELFLEGEASSSYFSTGRPLIYSTQEKETRTLKGLVNKINESLKKNGLLLKKFESTIDKMEMYDAFTVRVNGTVTIEVEDIFSTSNLSYSKVFETYVDITGFPDPLVNRYLSTESLDGYRYIYKAPYNLPKPKKYDINAVDGAGWFYGPIVSVDDADSVPETKRHLYILEGTYEDISAYSNSDDFGAYILTSAAVPISSKPYILAPTFSLSRWNDDEVIDYKGRKTMLFITDSESSPSTRIEVYGMEKFRDAVMCAYYFDAASNFVRNNGIDGSPSFLQRMLEDGYARADDVNGIFSFLVGREYGGELNPSYKGNSKLDFEFVSQWINSNPSSVRIRGMPACKNKDMCGDSPSTTFLPQFSISKQNTISFGLEDSIACPEQGVGWGVSCG